MARKKPQPCLITAKSPFQELEHRAETMAETLKVTKVIKAAQMQLARQNRSLEEYALLF